MHKTDANVILPSQRPLNEANGCLNRNNATDFPFIAQVSVFGQKYWLIDLLQLMQPVS